MNPCKKRSIESRRSFPRAETRSNLSPKWHGRETFRIFFFFFPPTATLNNGRRPWKFIEDEREAGVQLVFPHAEECGGYQSVVGEFNFVTHRKECRRPLPPPSFFLQLPSTRMESSSTRGEERGKRSAEGKANEVDDRHLKIESEN